MLIPDQISNAKIIFSPLNWGMGHVSRSLPILKQLIHQENSITVFCSDEQERIYRQYFNNLCYERHEPYDFKFHSNGFNMFRFISQIPKLFKQHLKEKRRLKDYLRYHPTDYIISDQRFGFRNKSVFCIFITHQCVLPIPWYFSIVQVINIYHIKKFNQTWIVDDEQMRYAGKLSRKIKKEDVYIGIKSRFPLTETSSKRDRTLRVLIFNGPQEFHHLLLHSFRDELDYIDVVIGKHHYGLGVKQHVFSWREADEVLMQAQYVYSFSGYSTLMDIKNLGCVWKCIPTPGQKEQEYIYKKTLAEGLGLQFDKFSD